MDNNLIVQLLKRAAHGLGESHVTSATHSQLITDLFVAADGIEMQTALSGLEADGSTKQQFVQIAGIDNDLFALDAATAWRQAHPGRNAAQLQAQRHHRVPPPTCERCGETKRVEINIITR